MDVLGRVYDKLGRDNVFFMAAGLAFGVITTLVPLLVLLFSLVGYALASSDTAMRELVGAVRRFLPFASEEIVGSIVVIVQSRGTIGLIGLLGFIWLAAGVVSSVRTVLNRVFEARETRSLLAGKAFDLVMVVVLGVFFLLSLGLTTAFAVVRDFGAGLLGEVGIPTGWIVPVTTLGGALLVNVVMFTLLYRAAPARRVPLEASAVGGVVTAVLFEVAKHLFRLYVLLARQGTLDPASGTFGAIVLLLVWIYYSALVFIIGAEAAAAIEPYVAARRPGEQRPDHPRSGQAGLSPSGEEGPRRRQKLAR